MRLSRPHDWSSRRIITGVVPLGALALIVGFSLGSVIAALVLVAVVAGVDALIGLRLRAAARDAVLIRMAAVGASGASAGHGADCAVVGDVVELALTVTSRIRVGGGLADLMIAPIVPAEAEPPDRSVLTGSLSARESAEMRLRFRAARPGLAVFPGAVLRIASPLRLFSWSVPLPGRVECLFVPDPIGAADARMLRALQPTHHGRNVLRGSGTDFHELRECRAGDPMRRVDWKASARRARLLIREYEEPREYTVEVLLDSSTDMTHGEQGFGEVATLVARLAIIAEGQGMRFVLRRHDWGPLPALREKSASHLIAELATTPRFALVRRAVHLADEPMRRRLAARALARIGWPTDGRRTASPPSSASDADLDRALLAHFGGQLPAEAAAECAADLDPDAILDLNPRCARCGMTIFDDDASCLRCGTPTVGEGRPAPRAEQLCDALATSVRTSRGRGMLVVVTALRGGEACDEVASWLALAAAGHRRVHVAVPDAARLADARPDHPQSIGAAPRRADVLRDMDRLARAARVATFRRELDATGVHLHSLSQPHALDEIVTSLLVLEVRG